MKWSVLMLFFSSMGMAWTHLGNNIRGWKNSPVTFYVNYSNCSLSEAEINDIIDVAIDTWNGVTDSKLRSEEHTSELQSH